MEALHQGRRFTIEDRPLASIRRDFAARAVDEATVAEEMRRARAEAGYTLDPHTAIGVRAAESLLAADPRTPVVALATAHPAKFPDAVTRATGEHPALPPHMADLMTREERFTVLPNNRAAVEAFIRDRSRALRGEAA
jgi:threonine synthase